MPQISPVVNLGAPGLTGLVFQVYLQPTYDGVAVPVDSAGVGVSPLLDLLGETTANYQITGLPDPVPGGYGTVFIYASSGSLIRFYEYTLPAPPPLSLYSAQVTITENGPFTTADTIGAISLDIVGLPDPSTAAITFSAKTASDAYILQDRPAAASVITSLGGGAYSFTLAYALEIGHPLAVSPPAPIGAISLLFAEFGLDYGSGQIKRVPGDNSLILRVRRALG